MRARDKMILGAALAVAASVAAAFIAAAASNGQAPAPQDEKRVILADERTELYLPLLEGRRVAVFSNHSGIVGDVVDGGPSRIAPDDRTAGEPFVPAGSPRLGQHILDLLLEKGINVTAIFSPEHGFRGTADAGAHVASAVDEKTGVPVLSLYDGGRGRPSAESMSKFDLLLIDIQDVGLRYYTYYITMQRLMQACADEGKKVVLLDRPNPNGFYVDGPILDMSLKSGVGSIPIPIVHGMTLGELAMMMKGEGWVNRGLDLTVIPCMNYTHATRYSLIVAPSPNLKDMRAIYLYAQTCYFEGTSVSLGRGTDHPFEMYGHPLMKGHDYSFTPQSMPGAQRPPQQGKECFGTDLSAMPIDEIIAKGVDFEYVIDAYDSLEDKDSFFLGNGHFNAMTGQRWIREDIIRGRSAGDLKARWAPDIARFLREREPYLLYD